MDDKAARANQLVLALHIAHEEVVEATMELAEQQRRLNMAQARFETARREIEVALAKGEVER